MGQEHLQTPQDVTPPQGNPEPHSSADGSLQDDLARDALLRQYGQAMLKIGQLEAQVEQLTSQLQARARQEIYSYGPAPVQDPQGLRDLVEKVEALQKVIVHSPDRASGSTPSDTASLGAQTEGAGRRRYEEERRQMRLQMNSLANQLAQTEEELEEVRGSRSRRSGRHRRSSRTPQRRWWRKLSHLLRLTKSRSSRSRSGS